MGSAWVKELENFMIDYELNRKPGKHSDMLLWKEKFIPSKLYKYRSVNEYSLKNLAENTVWLNTPDEFNDPFDSAFSCTSQEEKIIKATQDWFEKTNYPIELRGIYESIVKLSINLKNNNFSNEMKQNVGVYCLTTVNDSILMWSHYADYHKGFCLGYDTSRFTEKMHTNNLYPVIYTDTMFDLYKHVGDPQNGNINHFALKLAAMYKASCWKYEKEWRLIWSGLAGLGIYQNAINFPQPTEIYFGAKTSDLDKNRILDCVKNENIAIYEMGMSTNSFYIEPSKHIHDGASNKVLSLIINNDKCSLSAAIKPLGLFGSVRNPVSPRIPNDPKTNHVYFRGGFAVTVWF